MSNLDVTETTLQFVIKVFAILLAVIVAGVLATYIIIVLRDGNDPLVQVAFSDLVDLGKWALITMGGIVVGKPIASGVGNFFNQKNTDINTVAQNAKAAQTIVASLPQAPNNPGETAP